MDGPDEIIHQSTRLKLTATLNALGAGDSLEFGRLKAILGTTDGNMTTHLSALEKVGYIELSKDFVGKRPRTRISLTRKGRRAFQQHVEYLKSILEGP
jgi:DNA-binding MarR family transcriptional regulator